VDELFFASMVGNPEVNRQCLERYSRSGVTVCWAVPFSACDVLPSLRSGQIALDEAERFPAQSICQRLGV